jgi:hypothetical protein
MPECKNQGLLETPFAVNRKRDEKSIFQFAKE